jgi:hypothetical protein
VETQYKQASGKSVNILLINRKTHTQKTHRDTLIHTQTTDVNNVFLSFSPELLPILVSFSKIIPYFFKIPIPTAAGGGIVLLRRGQNGFSHKLEAKEALLPNIEIWRFSFYSFLTSAD